MFSKFIKIVSIQYEYLYLYKYKWNILQEGIEFYLKMFLNILLEFKDIV